MDKYQNLQDENQTEVNQTNETNDIRPSFLKRIKSKINLKVCLIVGLVIGVFVIVLSILMFLTLLDNIYNPTGCRNLDIPFSTTTLRVKQYFYEPYFETSDQNGRIFGYSRRRSFSFFSYPVIDFVTSNYTGSKYSTMRYNYYLLLDCMTNTVEYTMSRVYLTVYPTWEIRGNNGLLIGILKSVSLFGVEQSFVDSLGRELAYFSHPIIYTLYDWTIRISNVSVSQGINPNLYPFLARSIEYSRSKSK